MTLDQYVETLSEEEKDRHKDLIEECRSRISFTRKCFSSIIWPCLPNLSAEVETTPAWDEALAEVQSAAKD
ncbi:MAG: hypothetical protein HQL08_14245 [Nitrospirae bacterium]|nr:hypothetical protein [Nitrospirota bacterium]